MHLEELVLADQLVDDLVEGVVEFEELVALVVLVGEDVLLQVHLHEVEQFEEQLADAEVLADHLPLEDREDYIGQGLLCSSSASSSEQFLMKFLISLILVVTCIIRR